MRTLAAALVLTLAASAAAGQTRRAVPTEGRPSTLTLSCGQARALVVARGAIVLGTGGHTYDRYVLHTGFCPFDQTTEPAFERTADHPQCYVGERCVPRRSEQPGGSDVGGGGGGGGGMQ